MNYGIMFSEELQKQGARAVPDLDILKYLAKTKQWKKLGDIASLDVGMLPKNVAAKRYIYDKLGKFEKLNKWHAGDNAAKMNDILDRRRFFVSSQIENSPILLRKYTPEINDIGHMANNVARKRPAGSLRPKSVVEDQKEIMRMLGLA